MATRRTDDRAGGQRPRRRRPGRVSPTNGSVTRGDIDAIHAEFLRGSGGLYTDDQLGAIREHLVYLREAIIDPAPRKSSRELMRRKALVREANRRAQREAAATRPRLSLAAVAA